MREAKLNRHWAYGIGLWTSILLLTTIASIETGVTCLECRVGGDTEAWIQSSGTASDSSNALAVPVSDIRSTIWSEHFTTRPAHVWIALLTLISVIWIGLKFMATKSR